MKLIDLSHVVEHGMTTYPGLPGPVISEHWSRESSRAHYAPGTEFHIARIDIVANTGTYVDTPFHRYADGADLSQVDLESLADLPGVLAAGATAGPTTAAHLHALADLDLQGAAVLIRTGWDRYWRTDEYDSPEHTCIDDSAARFLVEAGAALVGIDSINIDATGSGERPAHSRLLAAGVPIVEHLTNLDVLDPGQPFRFFAVPVKIAGVGTFPVRAFALLPEAPEVAS